MKKQIQLSFFTLLTIALCSSFNPVDREDWVSLLDTNLSQWEMYLSYRHTLDYKGDVPLDQEGKPVSPIGYNKNVNDVFSIIEENGAPVLRISGEIYGAVFTKNEYENYHLKLKVKWGDKKWEPRLEEARDSGILYHSQGDCGVDYWRAWMLSQEFQIMESGFGDYWCIANSQIDIKAVKEKDDNYVYDKKGKLITFGSNDRIFCQHSDGYEKPHGEWNEIELICFKDKSLHIVNGHVVMALSKSRYKTSHGSTPLTKGKIQLQSEAAEVFYKDIMIQPIARLPKAYQGLF